MGYAGLRRRLERRWPPPDRPAAGPRSDPAAVARAVDRAARHHLYPMRCLQRSLALEHLLRQEGHAAAIRFGVRRGDRLAAHAWVEVDGRPLGEPGEIEARFARLVPVAEAGPGPDGRVQARPPTDRSTAPPPGC